MKSISLSRGKAALVDDVDFPTLCQFRWFLHVKKRKTFPDVFYAVRYGRNSKGKSATIFLHRQIMQPANGFQVDHIDHDGLNNQRVNLRVCTASQNGQNRRVRSRDLPRGVSFHKWSKKFQARIHVNGKRAWLGLFQSPNDAAAAYNAASHKYHGEFGIRAESY